MSNNVNFFKTNLIEAQISDKDKRDAELIFEKIKNAKSSEVSKITMKFLKNKLDYIDKDMEFNLAQIHWLCYSTFRQCGRGKISSWMLANSIAFEAVFNKVLGSNNIEYINKKIAYAMKKPVMYYLRVLLERLVLYALPGSQFYLLYVFFAVWFRLCRNILRKNNEVLDIDENLKKLNVSYKYRILIESAIFERY